MKFSITNLSADTILLNNFGDERITVNNKYMSIDGKPVIPVMGELHYSRVPEERWEEELKKMKEGGIDIVASYVFWIHHEEERGTFDFSGNRNIRKFVERCHANGLEFCLRIGPWAHGECRNGGFPDWLYGLCGNTIRTLNDPFFSCVSNYVSKIGEQLCGLRLFGIQIENECYNNNPAYYERIRQLCVENGMTAPIYTATGWGNATLPETLIPMFGGYPSEPWTENVLPETPNTNYFFADNRSGGKIGSDLDGVNFIDTVSYVGRFPYFTCELGGGNQVTYHRRPMFVPEDIEALPVCKLGSGCNLLGYFMYHGGLNPIGKTTMQESKATKYINDYPVISYDFQSPLGDNGQIRESYYRLRNIHRFVHSFGTMLAPMEVYYPDIKPKDNYDEETVRASLRSDGEKGFIFICNHVRVGRRAEIKGAEFEVEFKNRNLSFTLDIPEDYSFILPVGLDFCGIKTDLVTAMPLSCDTDTVTFMKIKGLNSEMRLTDGRTISLSVGDNVVDGVKVVLEDPYNYVPTALFELEITEQNSTVSTDILLSHLTIEDNTTEYSVKWEKGTTFIVVRAKGNIAGFFISDKLVNDFYLYHRDDVSDAFVIDVRDIDVCEGVLKIQPYTDSDEGSIWYESEMPKGKIAPEVYYTKENILKI